MGNLLEVISRAWSHRKLHRGQCRECRAILPDAATSRFCNAECLDAFEYASIPVI